MPSMIAREGAFELFYGLHVVYDMYVVSFVLVVHVTTSHVPNLILRDHIHDQDTLIRSAIATLE